MTDRHAERTLAAVEAGMTQQKGLGGFSPDTVAMVEAALPAEPPGLRPHEVYSLLYFGSLISVRHICRELVRDGRAVAAGPNGHRRYWRRPTGRATQ